MRKVFALLIATLCSHEAVDACSFGLPPLVKLRADSVVIVGVVEEVISVPIIDQLSGTAWGIRIKVEEALLNAEVGEEVEIYPLATSPSCTSQPFSRDYVEQRFPPLSRVWMLGRKAQRVTDRNATIVRLEVWPLEHGLLEQFDPSAVPSPSEFGDRLDPRNCMAYFKTFDFVRVLVDLSRATAEDIRVDLLRHVKNALDPRCGRLFGAEPRYGELVDAWIHDDELRNQLKAEYGLAR